MAKLKEGAVGQAGKILTPGKGQLSVIVTPREGKGVAAGGVAAAMATYVDAAEAVLRRLAERRR